MQKKCTASRFIPTYTEIKGQTKNGCEIYTYDTIHPLFDKKHVGRIEAYCNVSIDKLQDLTNEATTMAILGMGDCEGSLVDSLSGIWSSVPEISQ